MVKQFSLILGGGAARGLAHIGIIRRLEEDQIMPSCIRQNEERSLCAYPEPLILRIGRDDIDYYAFHRVSELVDEGYKTSEPIAQYLQNYGHK